MRIENYLVRQFDEELPTSILFICSHIFVVVVLLYFVRSIAFTTEIDDIFPLAASHSNELICN